MRTLVVVDDEMILQLIYKHLFLANVKFNDFQYLSFTSIEDFLSYLKDHPDMKTDLLMLDLDLGPGLSGWDLLADPEALKRLDESLIYICTASILKEDKLKALAHKKVRGYFTKPITEAVIETIAKEMSL